MAGAITFADESGNDLEWQRAHETKTEPCPGQSDSDEWAAGELGDSGGPTAPDSRARRGHRLRGDRRGAGGRSGESRLDASVAGDGGPFKRAVRRAGQAGASRAPHKGLLWPQGACSA